MAKYNDLDMKSGKNTMIFLPIHFGYLIKEINQVFIMQAIMVILSLKFQISYLGDILKR